MDAKGPDAEAQALVRQQVAAQVASGIEYSCGDCASIIKLKPRDAVRCRNCGFRILYKLRTKRLTRFEAR